MITWTRRIAVAATLVTGCTATIEDPGSGSAPAPGTGTPGTGTPSTGTPGTGAPGTGTPGTGTPGTGTPGTPGTGVPPAAGAPPAGVNPATCVPGVPGTSQLPRLTRAQYDNTIRDLVGIEGQPSSNLAPDSRGSVDQRAWEGYQTAAESIATQVMANPTARARAIPCTPSGDGSACARQLVETFGKRAFRRSLTDAEITRYVSLNTNRAQITANNTFDEAAQLIIRAFLLSPSFLTRGEIAEQAQGDVFALSGYEVASRLSYMLWGSMPDEALFASAEAGVLATQEGILSQAQRMLNDPKARTKVSAFHEHYAHMGEGTRWAQIVRDPALYPAFNEGLAPVLAEETKRFFNHVVFEMGGSFRDLLTSPIGFVNAALAPIYGLNAAQYGADLVPVNLDPATRSGVFTRLGFLTSHSLYNRTSPIHRGAFLQKDVLCAPISAPPADAESTPLPAVGATNRERVDAQTAGQACAGCHHAFINPTGFALEAYDAIGAYQVTENGAPINTAATVTIGQLTVDVTGPVDLMTRIADSPEAQRCYAQKWVQYAYERAQNPADSCTVDNLASKLTQDGYTVVHLITDLTQSPSFRYRALETELAQ